MTDPEKFYQQRKEIHSSMLKTIKQRSAYVAAARLAAFALVAVCIYRCIAGNGGAPAAAIAVAGIILFIIFIRMSASLSEKKKLTTQLLFINRNELDIIANKSNAFDDGSSLLPSQMHTGDLDIFGPGSVYHLLNRTTTMHGTESLARQLDFPLTGTQSILEHQEAVRQFSRQPDTRQLIAAYGLAQEEKDTDIAGIASWVGTPERISANKWVSILKIILPLVAVAGFFLYLSNDNPLLLGIGFIGNWLVIGSFAKYTLGQHLLIGKKDVVLQQHGEILRMFSAADTGQSPLLQGLRSTAQTAQQKILRLSRLSAFFDQRLNLVVNVFLNGFFQYEIHVMTALEKWKKKNSAHFMQWISTVGEIEKLNSLATFCFNHPDYPFPAVAEGKPFISAKELGHPLIPRAQQVANDITAGKEERLLLITGSNMSGKSTFLRTIGVNMLLAQCGLPVCAASFAFAPMRILSSIRISDSLQENTSYFMAELKRLQAIIGILEEGTPALVLIDEVLRGTNSDDKTYGSEELIKKLLSYNCLAFFASHDLNLSVLENTTGGKVRNYCFESTIRNGELLFDYRLHRGVAVNKNASFLMKKMGIIS